MLYEYLVKNYEDFYRKKGEYKGNRGECTCFTDVRIAEKSGRIS